MYLPGGYDQAAAAEKPAKDNHQTGDDQQGKGKRCQPVDKTGKQGEKKDLRPGVLKPLGADHDGMEEKNRRNNGQNNNKNLAKQPGLEAGELLSILLPVSGKGPVDFQVHLGSCSRCG